jgi:hypothetical protein
MWYAFMDWGDRTRARGHESPGTHWRCVALLAGQVNWVCVERDELHGLDSSVIRNELHGLDSSVIRNELHGLDSSVIRNELHGLGSTVIRNELHRRSHFSLRETIGGLPKPFVLLRVPCEERPGFPG